jgi:putative pyruvate formate lyase activating enzyme
MKLSSINVVEMTAPSYLRLAKSGELENRIENLYNILGSCELCPRKCRVNRLEGEKGVCKSGKELVVSSYSPHFGEEKPLVGTGGSGTIFLTSCNLLCIYCQNYEISHLKYGEVTSNPKLARYMMNLQHKGCHNINFVTPTHFAPQLVKAIQLAVPYGFRLPIVWNCSGYENVDVLKLLEGIIDIYMPDIKYSQSKPAKEYSCAPDYFERCKESVIEMHRQVGDLKLDKGGISHKGILIRHLVLPNNLAGSEEVLKFVAEKISINSYVNIMSQYRPAGLAYKYEKIRRRPNIREVYKVIEKAHDLGLTNFL